MNRWEEEGFAPVRARWLDHAPSRGEQVELVIGKRRSRGLFRDIADDGALVLEGKRSTRAVPLAAMLNG